MHEGVVAANGDDASGPPTPLIPSGFRAGAIGHASGNILLSTVGTLGSSSASLGELSEHFRVPGEINAGALSKTIK